MTNQAYKRFSRVLRRSYPSIAATVALVIALVGVPGVTAGGLLVTSKQIKNNSITSADIRKSAIKTTDIGANAVRSADIQPDAVQGTDIGTGQVSTSDIGEGEVTPGDVTMPDPRQCKHSGTATLDSPSLDFQKVVDLCAVTKTDPTSDLEVTWTGSVHGENGGELSGCVFQIRVDGQPSPGGGGEIFKQGTDSVSSSALFPGLAPGPHTVEVWARVTIGNAGSNQCVVGPPTAGVGQTTVAKELVI